MTSPEQPSYLCPTGTPTVAVPASLRASVRGTAVAALSVLVGVAAFGGVVGWIWTWSPRACR